MTLADAIRRFRAVEEATTSAMVGARTTGGLPFYGRTGLKVLERERKQRMGRQRKCKGYDPKCRDAEWDVKVPVGGVALLRRSKLGEDVAPVSPDRYVTTASVLGRMTGAR